MDSQSRDDLRRLVRERPGVAGLEGAARPAPKLASSALGTAPAGAGGAGIASPLTEPDAATRTYHTARIVTTTDGVFTFEIEDLATIAMTDANGRDVVLEFDAPA